MIKNTLNTYGSVTKFFHWLMAALLVGMYTVAYIMINISKSNFRLSLFDLHKATGLLLFCLVAVRLSWRLMNPQPALSKSIPRWQRRIAGLNLLALYFLMFLMPMSGFLTSTLGGHDVSFYGLFTISSLANNDAASDFFAEAHEIFSYLLIITFAFHILGAIYHHYFLKDNVLKRMWISNQS